jgi:hypothetical protein
MPMLKRRGVRMTGAVIAGVAWLCFSGCGAEEAAQGPEEPGATQVDPGGSGAQAQALEPAMREGLRETAVGTQPDHEKQLRPQSSSVSDGGNGRGSNCVRAAATPQAASFVSTTNPLSIPVTALTVCREAPATGSVEMVQIASGD